MRMRIREVLGIAGRFRIAAARKDDVVYKNKLYNWSKIYNMYYDAYGIQRLNTTIRRCKTPWRELTPELHEFYNAKIFLSKNLRLAVGERQAYIEKVKRS